MMNRFFLTLVYTLALLLLSFSSVHALQVQADVSENVTLTPIETGNFSLYSEGRFEIHNPSTNETIYEFSFPFSFDQYVDIKIDLFAGPSNLTRFNREQDRLWGYLLEPNETLYIFYNILGLVDYDVLDAAGDQTMFEYYLKNGTDLQFVVKPRIKGEKIIRKNESEVISDRLVAAQVFNPTVFDMHLRNLSIYRTDTLNPGFFNGTVIKNFTNITLLTGDTYYVHYLDNESYNNSVYWMGADFVAHYFLTSFSNQTLSDDVISVVKKGSDAGGGGASSGGGYVGPAALSFIVKKNVDKNIILQDGETFRVTVSIANNNNIFANNVILTDIIPPQYELVDGAGGALNLEGNLIFDIDDLGPFEVRDVTYELKNKEILEGVIKLPKARVDYKSDSWLSNEVEIFHGLPDKRIFIEKEIIPIDATFSKVVITVRNLGTVAVEDILVTDIIDNNAIIKEISQLFHENRKGVWSVNILEPGEEWVVSYLIENTAEDLDTLPSVFGIDKSEVFGILISAKEIVLQLAEDQTMRIERVGLGVAVGLLLFYLFF